MKFENTKTFGFENAIIGLRLPMCKDFAEARSKSKFADIDNDGKDLDLMQRLVKADEKASGQPNGKFLRMIHVQVAITAPMYFWSELDTYKVGTVNNSTSKMHKLASYPITKDCFEKGERIMPSTIETLENMRTFYNETKNKSDWEMLLINLPVSWLQTRMFDCNYQTLRNIYHQRFNHKLTEWKDFCKWAETLPYAELICM